MAKFNWEKIMKEKTVVHVTTEEQAKKLLSAYDKLPSNRNKVGEKTEFMLYSTNTCYNLYENYYSSSSFYKGEGYTILEYKDVKIKNEKKCEECKNFEKVEKEIIVNYGDMFEYKGTTVLLSFNALIDLNNPLRTYSYGHINKFEKVYEKLKNGEMKKLPKGCKFTIEQK